MTFKTNDTVIHTFFGQGTICHTDQDVVEIDFSGERKRFSIKAMLKANVIQKYRKFKGL